MSRLSESTHSALTDTVLQCLFKKNIYTALSFIQVDPELIAKFTGLNYTVVLKIREAILCRYASPVIDGCTWYKDVMEQSSYVLTGIKNLDQLLGGGFVTGKIYEFCGGASSGKTQICITTTVHISKTLSQPSVLYIDTKNDVCIDRIITLLKCNTSDQSVIEKTLEKIQMCRIKTLYELLTLLHKIRKDLSEPEQSCLKLKLIIIDSLAALVYPLLGDQINESLCLLNNIANVLHNLAVEYHLTIVITNLVTSWTQTFEGVADESDDLPQRSQSKQQPALGKYWAHVPNMRINVKRMSNTNDCLLTVVKSTNQPIGRTVKVSVTDAGVQ